MGPGQQTEHLSDPSLGYAPAQSMGTASYGYAPPQHPQPQYPQPQHPQPQQNAYSDEHLAFGGNQQARRGPFTRLAELIGLGSTKIFPDGTLEETQRQAISITAVLVIAFGLLTLVSQLSYDPLDPSMNTASSRTDIHNWLGRGGAIWADIGFQWWGYTFYLVGPFLVWWGALALKRGRIWFMTLRLLALPLVLAVCAGFLALFDITTGWSKPRYAGGAMGDLVLGNAAHWLHLPHWLTATICLPLMIIGLGWLIAQPLSRWQGLGLSISTSSSMLVSKFIGRWAAPAPRTMPNEGFTAARMNDGSRLPVFVNQGAAPQGATPQDMTPHQDFAPDMQPLAAAEAPAFSRTYLGDQDQPAPVAVPPTLSDAALDRPYVAYQEDDDPYGDLLLDDFDDELEDAAPIPRATAPAASTGPRVVPRAKVPAPTPALDDGDFDDDLPAPPREPELMLALDESLDVTATGPTVAPKLQPPAPATAKAAPKRKTQPAATKSNYNAPSFDLLALPSATEVGNGQTEDDMREHAEHLTDVLAEFGVKGEITAVRPGPVVTLYELKPAPGTKTARVVGLADDIARSMSVLSVRIATVPGRNVIGIELPNPTRETVYLREMLETDAYSRVSAKLPIALGKNIGGEPVYVDLAKMPHLLVAGTTGSGKSVAVNTMILSLLYTLPPERCKFIMIDPKMLELSVYDGIPHLLSPVVTEPKKAVVALNWAVREMEERYRAMANISVRNLEGYNRRLEQARKSGEVLTRKVQTGFNIDTGAPEYEEQEVDLTPLPLIVIIIDEMADLMLVAGKEIEGALQRLAQMARAAGIHIVMATQRPSTDVITGVIKANFPTRISFHVTSKIDSRVILNEMGAEQLLGQGDMLYMPNGGRIQRVHGPFASDDEVEEIVNHLRGIGEPDYIEAISEDPVEAFGDGGVGAPGGATPSGDDLYDQAVATVLRDKKASTSYVQRQLQIGYNRAARLIERMEAEGLISAADRVGRREIIGGVVNDPE